MKNSSSSP